MLHIYSDVDTSQKPYTFRNIKICGKIGQLVLIYISSFLLFINQSRNECQIRRYKEKILEYLHLHFSAFALQSLGLKV